MSHLSTSNLWPSVYAKFHGMCCTAFERVAQKSSWGSPLLLPWYPQLNVLSSHWKDLNRQEVLGTFPVFLMLSFGFPCIVSWSLLSLALFWLLSRVRLIATPQTVAHEAALSMGFPRQEYWSGLPFPSPVNLSDPGNQTQVSCIAGRFFTKWATREDAITEYLPL